MSARRKLGQPTHFLSNPQTWATFGDARIEEWDKIRYFRYFPHKIVGFHRSLIIVELMYILHTKSHMLKTFSHLLLVFSFLMPVHSHLKADQGEVDGSVEKKALFYLNSIVDNRKKLNSAVVFINDQIETDKGSGEVQYCIIFDQNNQSFRCEEKQEGQLRIYAVNSMLSFTYVDKSVLLNQPTWIPEHFFSFPAFDIRSEGLPFSLYHCDVDIQYSQLDSLTTIYKDKEVLSFSEESLSDSDNIVVTFKSKIVNDLIDHSLDELTFAPQYGYSMIRCVSSNVMKDNPTPEVYNIQEVSYKPYHSDNQAIWLPERWINTYLLGKRTETRTFQWQSVNHPIDESLFQPEGLDVPDNTKVFDARLGTRGVIIGYLYDGTIHLEPKALPVTELPHKLRLFSFQSLMFVIGLGVIVFITVLAIRKSRKDKIAV